ncbi:hypothetical protein GYMLUDRAFT_257198 [Collybiopsis luxurians FD-317 M1]|nr:hypothetical protein GYMLUDRAFT_257198 [Collybiopsis luxurians FD-317 M1]
MSVLPDHATPIQLASIDDAFVGHKLELAGRMMSYDSETGFILLSDKDVALLVDVALCLDRGANIWVQNRFIPLQVIGHLDKCSKDMPIPMLPPHMSKEPKIDSRLILRAIMVIPASAIDQNKWNYLADKVRLHAQNELGNLK